jgi:hypothetical protein
MAVITAKKSPATSCWVAAAPAMMLATVIVPVTLPCRGQGGARPVGSGLVAVWHRKDDDAAVHARWANMDVRLRHRSLQPAIVAVNTPLPVVDTEDDSS